MKELRNGIKIIGIDHSYGNIRISGCSVFPHGYTAVVDRLSEMMGVNMLADIGNGTMNIMYINNKKPVESKDKSE